MTVTKEPAMIERTIKCVVVAAGTHGKYAFKRARVVECRADQRGYLSERGVRLIRESGPLYRPVTKTGRGIGPETIRRFEQIAADELRRTLGIDHSYLTNVLDLE